MSSTTISQVIATVYNYTRASGKTQYILSLSSLKIWCFKYSNDIMLYIIIYMSMTNTEHPARALHLALMHFILQINRCQSSLKF